MSADSTSGYGTAVPLELRHLRVLVALVEEGTFTDAAIRLGLSQPAVSRALARFEQLAGVELVRRTTRSLSLTAAGQACYRAAVDALTAVDSVLPAARGQVGPLRLGFNWAAFGRYTSAILRTWRQEHPDVPLEVHRVDERSAGLRTGLVDVAVRRDMAKSGNNEGDPPVRIETIFTEGRLAAVPAGSPLAQCASLTLADLAHEPIVLVPTFGTTSVSLWPAPDRPTDVVAVTNTDEWLMTIASGAAVGVTAESTPSQHPHPGVRFVPLRGVPDVTVSLVWPRDRPHPAITPFRALVHRVIGLETPQRPERRSAAAQSADSMGSVKPSTPDEPARGASQT